MIMTLSSRRLRLSKLVYDPTAVIIVLLFCFEAMAGEEGDEKPTELDLVEAESITVGEEEPETLFFKSNVNDFIAESIFGNSISVDSSPMTKN
jgi:hypothetical protein